MNEWTNKFIINQLSTYWSLTYASNETNDR